MAMTPADQAQGYKARLLDAIFENDSTRDGLLGLIHERFPNVRIPEIQAQQQTSAAIKPLQDTVQQLQTELAERDLREAHGQVRRRFDFSDSEWGEVQDLANKRQIGDMSAAAELYLAQQQTASPRYAPTPIRQPAMKELWANPTRWAREEAYNVLNEAAAQATRRR